MREREREREKENIHLIFKFTKNYTIIFAVFSIFCKILVKKDFNIFINIFTSITYFTCTLKAYLCINI